MSEAVLNWLLARSPRERFLLALLVLIGLPCLMVVNLLPLKEARQATQLQLEETRDLHGWVLARAQEQNQWQGTQLNTQPIGLGELDRSLTEIGLRAAVSGLSENTEGLVILDFASVSYVTLVSWLSQMHAVWGYDILDYRFEALERQGLVRASLRLSPLQ